MKCFLSALLLLGTAGIWGADLAGWDDARLLARIDEFRVPDDPLRYQVTIRNLESGAEIDQDTFEVSSKGSRSRIAMLSPRSKGQIVLVLERQMWIKMPKSKRVIRITPLQRLSGQASFSDLGRLRFGQYSVSKRSPVGEAGAVLELDLEAKVADLTFPRVRLQIDSREGFPLSAEVFLPSGKKFRTLTFGTPTAVLGRSVITRYTIQDEAQPQWTSELTVSDIRSVSLADNLFSISALEENG